MREHTRHESLGAPVVMRPQATARPIIILPVLLAALTAGCLCVFLLATGPHAPIHATDLATITSAQADTPVSPSEEKPVMLRAASATDPAPLSSEEVLEVQSRLQALEFDPGPLDGIAGPRTTSAILRFQGGKGRTQTGLLDRELLDELKRGTR